ncbi:MAG: glycosyl hydrolase, partial [Bacteroidota bacterium]
MRRLLFTALFLSLGFTLTAQDDSSPTLDAQFAGLQFRNIGPFRGGRSNTASGVPGNPLRYYFGSTGGGVWQTDDAGQSWRNISDEYFNTGSIGAITVAPSDPNVLY